MTAKQHWETVYATKAERDVSWFEPSPDVSLAMIEATGVTVTRASSTSAVASRDWSTRLSRAA